jgi:hypothetical protein
MLQKFIQSALLLVVLFTTVHSYAQVSQAPDGIQFQALATDANGHPAAGRVIYVKNAIIAKIATGSIVYSETFKVTASSAGIFTIVLGKGTYAGGVSSIANIDWSNGPFFLNLKVAVEPTIPTASWNVNNEYVDMGTSQFWSVPYALYAGNVKGADTKLNIVDTIAMLKPYFTAINLKANIESPTFTGTVKGITKAMVGLGNVDNTSDLDKLISTATQVALDLKANVTDVNAALNLKANAADVTAALALKATLTDLNNYALIASPTFTGTVSGITKSMVGLTNVDNTTDAAKPISTATQGALDLKANASNVSTSLASKASLVSPALTGIPTVPTAIPGTNSNQIATTAYTTAAIAVAIAGATSGVADNSVTSAKIATGAVIDSKITSVSASKITGVLPVTNGGTGQTTVPGILSTLGFASNNVAIGFVAGTPNQGVNAGTIAIGGGAGRGNQGQASIAIGYVSGDQNQGTGSISIGPNAAQANQGSESVAIGYAAGQNNQGTGAIAIGTFAGPNNQAAHSIALNAAGSGSALNTSNAGFYVDPIRSTTATSNVLYYNPTSKEITTATSSGSFVDLTTAQTVAGAKIFSSDLNINGITAGMGSGNLGFNTVFGRGALATISQSGNYNLATGYVALQSNTTGELNTAAGTYALLKNTIGNNNTGYGVASLFNNTVGNNNTALGYEADVVSNNLTNATAIGYGAKVVTSNTIQLGNSSVTNVKTSGTITAGAITYPNTVGTNGYYLKTDGSGTATWAAVNGGGTSVGAISNSSTANGASITSGVLNLAPADATNPGFVSTGSQTIAGAKTFSADLTVNDLTIGRGSGQKITNLALGRQSLWANSLGVDNTALGNNTLLFNQTGSYNTASGYQALQSNTIGNNNTAYGTAALITNTSGNNNTADGINSLRRNTSGSNNTASGSNSLRSNTTGNLNTAIGEGSLFSNTEGNYNTASGFASLHINTLGYQNTAIGYFALFRNIDGYNNTAIGKGAGEDLTSGSNNTYIGHGAFGSSPTINNEITLGDNNVYALRAAVTAITSLSDRRDKTNIVPIGEGLAFLKQLNPVSFTWNTRDKAKVGIKSAGFIAQELLALQKQSAIGSNLDLVSENNPEKLEARYNNLLPVIVKAIQEESAEKDKMLEDQQKEIKALKERLNILEKLINELINKK